MSVQPVILLMRHSRKSKTSETIINTELKLVNNWLNLNKLSYNIGKTEVIFFHSPRHTFDYSKISIIFRGKKITPVDHIKYLGIYIDTTKLSCLNGIVSKLRFTAHIETLLQVYY